MLQIKNIKLHIVTDIKVTINSIFEFRISLFGWGEGHYNLLKKSRQRHPRQILAFGMDSKTVIIDNKWELHHCIAIGSGFLYLFAPWISFMWDHSFQSSDFPFWFAMKYFSIKNHKYSSHDSIMTPLRPNTLCSPCVHLVFALFLLRLKVRRNWTWDYSQP